MTMLTQWLQILVPAAVLWATVAYTAIKGNQSLFRQDNPLVQLILLLPFAAVIILGVYSLSVVLWKTYNFNDCKEAAEDLKKDITEAKEFLAKNGVITEE